MSTYQAVLQSHLAEYKANRLGVQESGLFGGNGRVYRHILPSKLRQLNVLEPFRAEFWAYHKRHPEVRLHRYFHHLNSSQALAFNLFFPFFTSGASARIALTRSLGIASHVTRWKFEHVPNRLEGTNVDVAWCSPVGGWVYCEVKLSETEFGAATPDAQHRHKLEHIYAKRLSGLVKPELLEPNKFFRHYQLLRNISFLSSPRVDHVVFLLPAANKALAASLARVVDALQPLARGRVRVRYLEQVLQSLQHSAGLPPAVRQCGKWLSEKYVPA